MLIKLTIDLGDGIIAERQFITSPQDLDNSVRNILQGISFKRAKAIDLDTGNHVGLWDMYREEK